VFIAIKSQRTAAAARSFLNELVKAAPFKIRTLLTDNGSEFTDRLFGSRGKRPTGEHEFDHLCQALGIEHRLTKPKTPQTNGMVERFNGRIEQVLRSHHFNSADALETTLHRYVWLYNEHLPQKALQHITPIEALKRWQKDHPQLFLRQVRNHPGPDTYRVLTTDREHDALLDDPAVQQAIFGLPWGNGAFRTKSAAVRGEQRSQARIRETPPVEAQIWIGSSDTEPLSTPFRGVFILPPIAIILGRM
jgi:hypothetical protein